MEETCGYAVELTGPDEILVCGREKDGHEDHRDGWTEFTRLDNGLFIVRSTALVRS